MLILYFPAEKKKHTSEGTDFEFHEMYYSAIVLPQSKLTMV